MFWAVLTAYAASWLFLVKASWDAGAGGAVGRAGLVEPDGEPQARAFRTCRRRARFGLIRQPIYLAFALTTWLVPVWTPDQLALAIALTAYLPGRPAAEGAPVFAPVTARGSTPTPRRTPYMVPRLSRSAERPPMAGRGDA